MHRFIIAIMFLFSSFYFAQEKQKEVEVIIGISKIVDFDFTPLTIVKVDKTDLLSYEIVPQKRQIILSGQKPGKTTVILRDAQTKDVALILMVNVSQNSLSKVVKELHDYLGDIEGLEINIKGEKVAIEGEIVVPDDVGRINVVLKNYPEVINLVELSPQTQRVIAEKMQHAIQSSAMPNVIVKVINKTYVLEGVVGSDGEKTSAERIASLYVPDQLESLARRTQSVGAAEKSIIQNFITVNAKTNPPEIPKQLKVTAQFVELSKDYKKVFGMKWTPLLSGGGGSIGFGKTSSGGVTTKSDGTFSGVISNLFPQLASAKSAGYARVVQSGVIMVQDGIQGQIIKNSQKKFALGSGDFTQAQEANAGFTLTVTPTIVDQEKISLNIGIDVSAYIGSPPETTSNKIQTRVIVKSKESAVIGGVVINKTSTDYDKDPPGGVTSADNSEAGAEPSFALFSFVRSKSYGTTRSQFVMFVTPEIVDSVASGTEEIKKKFRKRSH